MPRSFWALAALLALSFALSACGGSDSSSTDPDTGEPAAIVDDADPDAVAVIDNWAKALTDGDTEKAAGYFAIPSTAENGPILIKIRNAGRAEFFNESLPCGAVLTKAVTEGEFTTATFKLTDRPGGNCGDGAGGMAQTSFVIKDGKITDWRRVGDQPQSQPDSGQIT
ncbi:hypothetical protein BH10ACT11_BH10ACT11_17700 [soil metagenome]